MWTDYYVSHLVVVAWGGLGESSGRKVCKKVCKYDDLYELPEILSESVVALQA